jgi:hypothetical protein
VNYFTIRTGIMVNAYPYGFIVKPLFCDTRHTPQPVQVNSRAPARDLYPCVYAAQLSPTKFLVQVHLFDPKSLDLLY